MSWTARSAIDASMRAAQFHGEGRITVGSVPRPDSPGEIRVDVIACALCGSDLRPWRQGWPLTPGHEIAGRVNQPGHAHHGRRVLVYIPVFCGHCSTCRKGHTQLCETANLVGWQRPGGYADSLSAPEQCLLLIPDDVPDHLAPLLLDTIGTGAHGIRLASQVVSGGAALVIGAGPVGLGALIVLRRMGWGPLTIREPNDYRAEMAMTLGAVRITADDALARPVPLVLECSGKDGGRQLALEAVAPYGAVVQLGESDAWAITETRGVRRKDYFLIRSFYFPVGDFAANVELLRADRDDYARLVDATCSLDGLHDLFTAFAKGERLKPLLCPA